MNKLVGLIGLSVICAALGMYFHLPAVNTTFIGILKGLCLGMFVMGAGLFADSLKK